MRSIIKLPSPQGAAGGQTASVNPKIGLTYHQFLIYMETGGANTKVPVASWAANMGEIRLNINGDSKIRIDAADLVSLHKYYGIPLDAGVLPLFLSKPWARTAQGEDMLAYGTNDLQSLTLEMDIPGAVTVDKLTVHAVVSPGTPLGAHYTLRKYNVNQGVTGEREVSEIKTGRYGMLAAHLKTANVDKIEVEANLAKIVDQTPEIASAYYQQTGRVPQAGFTHIDHAATDRMSDAFNMDVSDFRFRFNFTGTGNFDLYTENVEGVLARTA